MLPLVSWKTKNTRLFFHGRKQLRHLECHVFLRCDNGLLSHNSEAVKAFIFHIHAPLAFQDGGATKSQLIMKEIMLNSQPISTRARGRARKTARDPKQTMGYANQCVLNRIPWNV